jgi:hypothetical protein
MQICPCNAPLIPTPGISNPIRAGLCGRKLDHRLSGPMKT